VAPGVAGELAARGPQVMIGYWRRPDETAKVMTPDGYFRTGDVAIRDADGSLRIIDRKKDLIIVSGFNVFPNEVEDVLAAHEGILECAVIGVPDGAAGEAVKAYIVRRDPALTVEAVREHCRKTLTAYKVPRHVEFRDELPKSTVGKILRKDLRGEELAKAPSDASKQAA
jgi:long-chain acyl-CoA synthetase